MTYIHQASLYHLCLNHTECKTEQYDEVSKQSEWSLLQWVPVVVGSSTDDGIGENIPTSNSGSAYSSPMYTPPEEESIHMHMAAQRREQELSGEEKEALQWNPIYPRPLKLGHFSKQVYTTLGSISQIRTPH